MKTFTLEQIAQVTGGMLTKAKDVAITNIAPPLLADENTLALALGEEEIKRISDAIHACVKEKAGAIAFFGDLMKAILPVLLVKFLFANK